MPIALDGDTVDVPLESDKDKPVETRPAFVCRYLTRRQSREYDKLMHAAFHDKNLESQEGVLDKALSLAVVGLKNMQGEIDDVLTLAEKWDLALQIPVALQISELDKKKLRFKSQSDGANSA